MPSATGPSDRNGGELMELASLMREHGTDSRLVRAFLERLADHPDFQRRAGVLKLLLSNQSALLNALEPRTPRPGSKGLR